MGQKGNYYYLIIGRGGEAEFERENASSTDGNWKDQSEIAQLHT